MDHFSSALEIAARCFRPERRQQQLESQRLRKAVSDLTLDKLILAEAAKGNF